MEIPCTNAQLEEVIAQVLCHFLRERRDEHAVVVRSRIPDLLHEIVDLALRRPNDDLGVDQPGGSDDLLDDLGGFTELPGARRRRQEDRLVDPLVPLVEPQRAVVEGGGESESVLDEDVLARLVPGELAIYLGNRHVALVDDHEEIVREVVEEREGSLTLRSTIQVPRVVLDPRAVPDLPHHLDVVARPHAKALGLEQLALPFEHREMADEFLLDAGDGAIEDLLRRDVVGGRIDPCLPHLLEDLARDGVHPADSLDLVAPVLDPNDGFVVGREHLQGVAPHPEGAACEVHLVALVLDVHEARDGL